MSEFKSEYQTTQNPKCSTVRGVNLIPEEYSEEKDLTEYEKAHNAENYPDPTCYKTIKKYEKEQQSEWERHHKLVGCILRVCELAGFTVENRIVLKDKKTGKVWE